MNANTAWWPRIYTDGHGSLRAQSQAPLAPVRGAMDVAGTHPCASVCIRGHHAVSAFIRVHLRPASLTGVRAALQLAFMHHDPLSRRHVLQGAALGSAAVAMGCT